MFILRLGISNTLRTIGFYCICGVFMSLTISKRSVTINREAHSWVTTKCSLFLCWLGDYTVMISILFYKSGHFCSRYAPDSALRHKVSMLGAPQWSQELDSVALVGPFQLQMLVHLVSPCIMVLWLQRSTVLWAFTCVMLLTAPGGFASQLFPSESSPLTTSSDCVLLQQQSHAGEAFQGSLLLDATLPPKPEPILVKSKGKEAGHLFGTISSHKELCHCTLGLGNALNSQLFPSREGSNLTQNMSVTAGGNGGGRISCKWFSSSWQSLVLCSQTPKTEIKEKTNCWYQSHWFTPASGAYWLL